MQFFFPEYNLNNFLAIQSEPQYQLATCEILLSNVKSYFLANLLNTVLEVLSVTFDTTFTYRELICKANEIGRVVCLK